MRDVSKAPEKNDRPLIPRPREAEAPPEVAGVRAAWPVSEPNLSNEQGEPTCFGTGRGEGGGPRRAGADSGGRGPHFDVEDPHLAAAAWSRLAEPGDTTAGVLVRAVGACSALGWVYAALGPEDHRRRAVAALCERLGADGAYATRLFAGLERWEPRLATLDPVADVARLERLGGTLLIPGTASWPEPLNDLSHATPFCVWARWDGVANLAAELARSVALVGARACTDYGSTVAIDLAAGLVDRGFAVISGGAYGIDAAAHRGALAAQGVTFVLLAGGVDRLYPAGNARLLGQIVEQGGAVMSEVPVGAVPSRSRFLQRNRLIAGLAKATIVVEAAWRSGALSTATHAQSMFRPVGAVPGPVTSMASAGCHRLMRDQGAMCVTDAGEAAELAGVFGQDLATEPEGRTAACDGMSQGARAVFDALPLNRAVSVDSIARAAGLSGTQTLAGLGDLSLAALAVNSGLGWRRA